MHTKILADNQTKKKRKDTERTANLLKSIKAAYNKRVAPKIGVANWQMKVMVIGLSVLVVFALKKLHTGMAVSNDTDIDYRYMN